MKNNFAEYIQDISFNDTSDRMVIVTTSKLVIIYKKVLKGSDYLILLSEKKNFKKESDIHDININKEKNEEKDSENSNSIDYDNVSENKLKTQMKIGTSEDELNEVQNKIKRNTVYFSERKKNPFFRSSIGLEHFNFNDNDFLENINQNELFPKNKEYEYRWELQLKLNIEGPVLRIQWANSEFGNLFACSGFNKWVYIFKEEKSDENLVWNHTVIKRFSDSVMDISFLPKIYSLQLASVTLDGYLKISKPSNSWKDWETDYELISKYGCTCLCCNPSDLDQLTIVIGCKKNKEEINNDGNINNITLDDTKNNSNKNINGSYLRNDLIKIIWFKNKSNSVTQGINDCGHKDDITDVDWANQNGRSYHMICSTSKDGKFIIWEINLFQENNSHNFFSYKNIFEFDHIKPLWRCSFNDTGIFASCIDEDGDTFVFLKTGKNKFVKLDIDKK